MTVEIFQKLCGFSMGIIHNNSMCQKKICNYFQHMPLSICCSVDKSCPILCNPMKCSMPGFPVLPYLLEFAQTHVHWVSDTIQPSHPCHLLLLLPSIFPSIRVFSNELALHIRWPKYRSFSLSISPSNEYSGLIYFRTDWFDFLAIYRLNYKYFNLIRLL